MTYSAAGRPRAAFMAAGGAALGVALAAAVSAAATAAELSPTPSIAHEFAGNHLHGIAYVPEADGVYLATHFGLFLLRDGDLFQVGEIRDDLMGFAGHPDDPEAFYASGHPRGGGNMGVILSQDGGASWEQIFTGIGDEVVDFHSMVASPADAERLYGVFAGQLYVGDAGTGEWRLASGEGISLEGFCWGVPCLAAAAEDRERLFAGTPEGLYVSEDAGESWQRLDGMSGAVAGVGAHPAFSDFLMAHSDELGLAVSHDGGATWRSQDDGIAVDGRDFIFGFAFDPDNADRAFAASVHGMVFKTVDGGRSWQMILGPDGPPS